MATFIIEHFEGGLSDDDDKGIRGAFKFGANLDIRKPTDSLSAGQALDEEGLLDDSRSPSRSTSPSASISPSVSASATPSASSSVSPSLSVSASQSSSTGISPSPSASPSASSSPSASVSPSSSISLSPSPSGGLTTIFADLIIKFVECKDGYTYGFGDLGYIYRRDPEDGVWTRVYKDPDPINGAEEWYNDDGETFLYWATTTGKLHRKKIPGLANWNDVDITHPGWPKTSLRPNVPHTMRECGGSLIICNGPDLALVGYDDSYTNEAVNLIPGNISKTLVERNGETVVGTYRESDPDRGFNGAIDIEVPLAQVGDEGDIVYNDMTNQVVLKRFPGGGKVNPGGVTVLTDYVNSFRWEQDALSWIDKQGIGNIAVFGVYGASTGKNGLYTYGRKSKDKPFVLNLEYQFEDIDEIGAVESVRGTLIASYRDGSVCGVKRVDANYKAEGVWEGLEIKAPIKNPDKITPWKRAELFMKPLPEGSWVEFWYKANKTGDFIRCNVASGSVVRFTTALAKKAVFRINANAEIFEPRVVVHPYGNQTPEVYRIRIYCQ